VVTASDAIRRDSGHARIGLVGEGEEQLCQAAFGCGIIPKDWRKSGVAERLGKTLAEGLTGAGVVGETGRKY
jgi:hypothetical protein